jgi:antitoxin VapB
LLVTECAFHPEDKAVSKVPEKVPEPHKRPPFDAEAWFARLDELGGRDLLPNGIHDELLAEPDARVFCDE